MWLNFWNDSGSFKNIEIKSIVGYYPKVRLLKDHNICDGTFFERLNRDCVKAVEF